MSLLGLLGIGGGSSSSSSKNTSTSQQSYVDNRSVVSSDSHDVANTNSNNTSYSQLNEWLTQYSNTATNSGNTSITDSGHNTSYSSSVANSGNTSVANSGNSLTQWLSSLTTNNSNSGNTSITDGRSSSTSYSNSATNSGNTSITDGRSTSTAYSSNYSNSATNSGNTSITDARSSSTAYTSTDARNLSSSNSGNTSTVINWTGSDAGALQLASLQSNLVGAVAGENIDALSILGRMVTQTVASLTGQGTDSVSRLSALGASVGDNAYNLASLASSNSMAVSSHMLDLTGELIDKLATGTGNAVAENAAIAQATAAQAQGLGSTAGLQRAMLIGGAVLLALVIMKK